MFIKCIDWDLALAGGFERTGSRGLFLPMSEDTASVTGAPAHPPKEATGSTGSQPRRTLQMPAVQRVRPIRAWKKIFPPGRPPQWHRHAAKGNGSAVVPLRLGLDGPVDCLGPAEMVPLT